ncbi:hypothetical protein [Bacillus altitudinis]|uniref:hypothetical protein n=1 Tax=Bacillus altitudinis TaxID=293387 RepID=UPI003F7C0FC3
MKTLKTFNQTELHNLIGSGVYLLEDHTSIEGKLLKKKGEEGTLVDYQMFWGEATILFGKRRYKVSMNIVQLTSMKEETIDTQLDQPKQKHETVILNTDELLDQYNDYMALYNEFGDKSYLIKANTIMNELKSK